MSQTKLPAQLAGVTHLGPVEAVYRSAPPNRWPMIKNWLTITAVFGAIAAVGFYGQPWLKRQGYEMVGVGAALLGAFGLIAIGAGGLFVVLFFLVMDRLLTVTNRQYVVVYRDGLANLQGGKLEAWPWSDVREVYQEIAFIQ